MRQLPDAVQRCAVPLIRKGGRGGKVKSKKQAVAIGLSEARKKGAKVPRKKKSSRAKSKS